MLAVGVIIIIGLLAVKRVQKCSVKVEATGIGVEASNNALYKKGEAIA